MIGALIGPIVGLASTFFEGQLEKTKANNEVKVATAKARATILQKQATGEIEWDVEAIKGSKGSWKDEWLTILFSIPLCLAFIPGMEDVVKNGFARLNELPDWYTYLLFLTVSAALGIRGLDKFRKK